MESQKVRDFWLGTEFPRNPLEKRDLWWKRPAGIDEVITLKFAQTLADAKAGKLAHWTKTPQDYVALIIVLDQFPRHIFRGKPESFASDPLALKLCVEGLKMGLDKKLHWCERQFFLLPLEHSEDIEMQQRSTTEFETLLESTPPEYRDYVKDNLDFAMKHQEIVQRFGRFPHRNAILGRASTPEEIEFLKQPGSGF